MAYRIEAELVGPVSAWLRGAGFEVRLEVPILGRRADLIGVRSDRVEAVELKLRDWREALRQAIAYQIGADRVWVAMPLAAASTAYRERWRFEAEHVGLLAVDDTGRVRAPIPAGSSIRRLPFVEDRVRKFSGPAPGSPPSALPSSSVD